MLVVHLKVEISNMADYAPGKIYDMILVLVECRNKECRYKVAKRLYAQRFPRGRHPYHTA